MRIAAMEDKRFIEMINQLNIIAEREAMKVWRMARRAEKRGVSPEVVNEIREEGHILYNTMTAYPERLLETTRVWKYAFR